MAEPAKKIFPPTKNPEKNFYIRAKNGRKNAKKMKTFALKT